MFVERGHLRKNTFFETSSKSHESLYPPEAQDLKAGNLLKIAQKDMTKRQVPRPIGSKHPKISTKMMTPRNTVLHCVSSFSSHSVFAKRVRSVVFCTPFVLMASRLIGGGLNVWEGRPLAH